jgi:hypothetical protein
MLKHCYQLNTVEVEFVTTMGTFQAEEQAGSLRS